MGVPPGDRGERTVGAGHEGFHLAGALQADRTAADYEDVAGIDEAKMELTEIVDFLRNPGRYSRLGGRISFSFSHCGVSFTPHLDATWQHEFMDQSRGITSQFSGAGLGSFSVRTDNPSRDSALVDAGIDAEINRTVTLFADYTVQAGQANYFGQSVQAGVKIGF